MGVLIVPTLVAFAIVLVFGPLAITALQKLKFGQVIRNDGPQSHLSKAGTPSMGGLLMILGVSLTWLILIKQYDPFVVLCIFVLLGFGIIGVIDDYLKITGKSSNGMRGWHKIILQSILSIVVAIFVYKHVGSEILLPFSDVTWDIGYWIIPVVIFIMIASSNSVNLTDGLDSLVSGMSLVYFASFALVFASGIIPSSNNMVIICASLSGACLGFIFYNRFPARLFMGDTGSLSLGAMIALVAIISKTILWIPIMGLLFVVSSVSVIIQVASYKTRKKRVFKMAPIHHHFELKGYHEVSITTTYIIITVIMCLFGLWAMN